MKKMMLLLAVIAVSTMVSCGDKPVDTPAQPAAVQTPPPAAQAPAQVAPVPAPTAPGAVPEKVEVKVEPGRSMVITDLQVGAPKPLDGGQLKFQSPGTQIGFKPDASVKLRPLPGNVPQPSGIAPQQAPATSTGSN